MNDFLTWKYTRIHTTNANGTDEMSGITKKKNSVDDDERPDNGGIYITQL